MIWLLAGAGLLLLLLLGLNVFARASVRAIRRLFRVLAALGGLIVTILLFLAGQGPRLLAALVLAGPMLWRRMNMGGTAGFPPPPGGGRARGAGTPPPRQRGSGMTRAEAYDVLGLGYGAPSEDILAAHKRLMRTAHPDAGGSDWLASRINQARDVLLG